MKRSVKSIAIITVLAMILTCIPAMSFAATSALAKVSNVTVTQSSSSTKTIVKWKKASSTAVKGYQVQRKVSGGTYKTIKTVTSRSTVKYTTGTQTVGKTYYYRVRAYKKTSSGKKVYGAWSTAKKLKITKTKFALKSLTLVSDTEVSGGHNIIIKMVPNSNCADATLVDAAAVLGVNLSNEEGYMVYNLSVSYNTGKDKPTSWNKAAYSMIPLQAGKTTWLKIFVSKDNETFTKIDSDGNTEAITYTQFFKKFSLKENSLFIAGGVYKEDGIFTIESIDGEFSVENL